MGGRGTGSGFRAGGNNPQAAASTASAAQAATAPTAAERRATAEAPAAWDTMSRGERRTALLAMENYVSKNGLLQTFGGPNNPWEQMTDGVWQFDADKAAPAGLRTKIGAMIRRTVDARGQVVYEATTYDRNGQDLWHTFSTTLSADEWARRGMRRRVNKISTD